jgi:hypothetical protein
MQVLHPSAYGALPDGSNHAGRDNRSAEVFIPGELPSIPHLKAFSIFTASGFASCRRHTPAKIFALFRHSVNGNQIPTAAGLGISGFAAIGAAIGI